MNIDREMAEKVMGWQLGTTTAIWYKSHGMEHARRTMKESSLYAWHPSTDINQALGDGKSLDTVVGKMKERGWLLNSLSELDEGGFEAVFEFYNIETKEATLEFEEADTPAMSICKAAKKAMEG